MSDQRYWHWEVITGDLPAENGQISNSCKITIHQADSEEDAISQAKEKVSREYYTISQVYECHDCEGRISDEAYKLQTLKMMKGFHN